MNILFVGDVVGHNGRRAFRTYTPELRAKERIDVVIVNGENCAAGKGFTRKGDVSETEHAKAAQEALAVAREALTSGVWDLVILDEINYAVKFGLLTVSDVLALLDLRPKSLHVVLTGRDAAPEIIARADLVTEMHLVKHPYQKGIKAQKGIEF